MDLESGNSDEEITDDEVDSQIQSEIQSEYDAHHKLEEKEGSVSDVRRRCAGWYEKVGHVAVKKVKTFYPDYNKFFCLDCFNHISIALSNKQLNNIKGGVDDI